jgi:hypothetical protein
MCKAGKLNFFFGREKGRQETDQLCFFVPEKEAWLLWLNIHIVAQKQLLFEWFLYATKGIQRFHVLFLLSCKNIALYDVHQYKYQRKMPVQLEGCTGMGRKKFETTP